MFVAVLLLSTLAVAAAQVCYINQCGCPGNPTAPTWCNWVTNAKSKFVVDSPRHHCLFVDMEPVRIGVFDDSERVNNIPYKMLV